LTIHPVGPDGILGVLGQQVSNEIVRMHKELFDHAEKGLMAAHELIPHINVNPYDGRGVIVTAMYFRSLTQSQAALLLCKHGMPIEAMALSRGIVELVIQMRAIQSDKIWHAHHLRQHLKDAKRIGKAAKRSKILSRQAQDTGLNIDEQINEILNKLSEVETQNNLSDVPIPKKWEYDKAAGMTDEYDTMYQIFCNAVHNGLENIMTHLDSPHQEKLKKFQYGVSDDGLGLLLVSITHLLMRATDPILDRFKIEQTEALKALCESHNQLGKMFL
jgi:hypothetical protein